MTVTAENIRDDVVKNLAGRTDITEAILYRFIHYAQVRISRLKVFNELNATEIINTVASTPDYTFPGTLDARRVKRIEGIIPEKDSNNTYEAPLTRVPTIGMWNKSLSGRLVADTINVPSHYLYWIVNQLSIRPIPDVIYKLHISYSLHPVEVTEAVKANEISLYNADDIIMQLTTSMIAFMLGLDEKGTHYFRAYRASVKEMVEQEGDHADFNMQAIKKELDIRTPSAYWQDPFYNQTGAVGEQV